MSSEGKKLTTYDRRKKISDEEDYIDLAEIAAAIWRNRIIFVICLVLGLVGAIAAYTALPVKWRATATLQIGQMPDLGNATSKQTALIEPSAQVVEKLQLLDQEILTQAGLNPTQKTPAAKLLLSTMKATQLKNTNLIQVSVAGFSDEQARKHMEAITAVVLAKHGELFVPTVNRLTAQLKENANQIPRVRAAREETQALLQQAEQAKALTQFAPTVLAMQLIESKDAELRMLEEERIALADLAAPSKTYMTRVVGGIKLEDGPYFPKLPLFLALGLFLGTLLGAGLTIGREWQRKKAITI